MIYLFIFDFVLSSSLFSRIKYAMHFFLYLDCSLCEGVHNKIKCRKLKKRIKMISHLIMHVENVHTYTLMNSFTFWKKSVGLNWAFDRCLLLQQLVLFISLSHKQFQCFCGNVKRTRICVRMHTIVWYSEVRWSGARKILRKKMLQALLELRCSTMTLRDFNFYIKLSY